MAPKNPNDENWNTDWTAENPDAVNADAEADAIEKVTGIPEPENRGISFAWTTVIPVLAGGVLLIIGFWKMVDWLGITR